MIARKVTSKAPDLDSPNKEGNTHTALRFFHQRKSEKCSSWSQTSFTALFIFMRNRRARILPVVNSMTCRTYAGIRHQPLITASLALLISLIFSLWCVRHNFLWFGIQGLIKSHIITYMPRYMQTEQFFSSTIAQVGVELYFLLWIIIFWQRVPIFGCRLPKPGYGSLSLPVLPGASRARGDSV